MADTQDTTTQLKFFTLDLGDGGGRRAYLARITGPHPVYKLQREFVDPESCKGRWKHYRFSGDGIYEEVGYSAKGNKHERFIRLEGGVVTELTKEDVLALFNAPEKGQAPARRSSGRCPECDLWLPEHEITCALIDHPSYQ